MNWGRAHCACETGETTRKLRYVESQLQKQQGARRSPPWNPGPRGQKPRDTGTEEHKTTKQWFNRTQWRVGLIAHVKPRKGSRMDIFPLDRTQLRIISIKEAFPIWPTGHRRHQGREGSKQINHGKGASSISSNGKDNTPGKGWFARGHFHDGQRNIGNPAREHEVLENRWRGIGINSQLCTAKSKPKLRDSQWIRQSFSTSPSWITRRQPEHGEVILKDKKSRERRERER